MAVEQRRGCGYRKIGATYVVSKGLSRPCARLPAPLHVCPTCSQGIKQTRGWTWVNPGKLLVAAPACPLVGADGCVGCSMAQPERMGERCGLLWVGEQFYRTTSIFMAEASRMGVSRRISAIPRGFVLGETWVLLAHPKAVTVEDAETGQIRPGPGIFGAFLPTAIERLVSEEQAADEQAMHGLRERGITPVVVSGADKDHRGTVYDRPQYGLPLIEGEQQQ
jgi:hypothetical protein